MERESYNLYIGDFKPSYDKKHNRLLYETRKWRNNENIVAKENTIVNG